MEREYMLDSRTDLGHTQLQVLEGLLDGHTTGCLEATGVRPGLRCLDLGAGGGSITRWLADRVTPGGSVTSVDIDTDHLTERSGVRVLRHDINDGVPADGVFDLIHVRLLLMHLTRREAIFKTLVDALAPGGWLVIGDYSGGPRPVVAAPQRGDREVFHHVQDMILNVVARSGGVSYQWSYEIDRHMTESGLEDVYSLQFSHTTAGGTPGCQLYSNYAHQAEAHILDAGVTESELRRFHDLMLDPGFRAWFYEFTCTRGRKPTG